MHSWPFIYLCQLGHTSEPSYPYLEHKGTKQELQNVF